MVLMAVRRVFFQDREGIRAMVADRPGGATYALCRRRPNLTAHSFCHVERMAAAFQGSLLTSDKRERHYGSPSQPESWLPVTSPNPNSCWPAERPIALLRRLERIMAGSVWLCRQSG
jgi:hypothetical protein